MAINISLLFVPLPIFLVALIFIVAAIIALTLLERRLHEKIIITKEEENTYFRRKLESVKNFENEPVKFLSALDGLAREFFEEEFQISGARYSDLIESFKKEKSGNITKFCEVMQETLYSGEKLGKERLDFLFNKLGYLIKEREKEKPLLGKVFEKGNEPVPTKQVSGKFEDAQKFLPSSEFSTHRIAEIPEQFSRARSVPRTLVRGSSNTSTSKEVVNMNIVKYLAEGRKRGFEVALLKEKLLAGGFKEKDIDKAIQYVKNHQSQAGGMEMPHSVWFLSTPEIPTTATTHHRRVESRCFNSKKEWQKERRELNETEKKRILAKFFHPKNMELETIKKEVEAEEEMPKTEIIEIVPYKKEEIKITKKEYPKKEPKSYQYIGSMDDLERVKQKIKERKQELASEGFKGAKLGSD